MVTARAHNALRKIAADTDDYLATIGLGTAGTVAGVGLPLTRWSNQRFNDRLAFSNMVEAAHNENMLTEFYNAIAHKYNKSLVPQRPFGALNPAKTGYQGWRGKQREPMPIYEKRPIPTSLPPRPRPSFGKRFRSGLKYGLLPVAGILGGLGIDYLRNNYLSDYRVGR